jgi:hypothetical protein
LYAVDTDDVTLSCPSSPPVIESAGDAHDPRRTRRCWPTGAIYLLVGVTLLITLLRAHAFTIGSLTRLAGDIREMRGADDGVVAVALLAGLADTVAGAALILFPIRLKGSLIAALVPATLVHLGGIALGAACVVCDDWNAQWGGLTTMLGLVVAVPSLLMLTLGAFAMRRIVRGHRTVFQD